MNRILRNWSISRIIRLAAGVIALVNGIVLHEWILVIFGGLFTLTGLFNLACCAEGGCSVPQRGRARNSCGNNAEG
jgi:hypothetical protein